ncbi:ABC transporter permease [Pantoea sp. XY16]|uniref:ABC transporter permease n=1 Tax=Pantoea sp. XY16 TaxID=2976705 RepID=UPI0021A87762|nr:ABC transporter permease [Pantoea sp. XY16]MCT2418092.1 ABC transporter permease [Pantoea sp. XY16]
MKTNVRQELFAWLLMISGLGTILMLMGSTFYVLIAQSIGYFNLTGESYFTLQYWSGMLRDPVLVSSLLYSLKVSLLGALGAVILAYPIALWLRKPLPMKESIIAILRIPMFIPGLVAAFLFINIISFHGAINEFLLAAKVIGAPLRMQNDSFGTGVIVLQIWKNMPFALILISSSVNTVKNDLLNASVNLGANKWQRFITIVLPLTLPAVQVALIIVFIDAIGDFAFYSVAGPHDVYSLARLMQSTAMEYGEWNNAAVIAMIIMITSLLFSIAVKLMITPFMTCKGDLK